MEELFFERFKEGIVSLFEIADWSFVVCFMVWTWLTSMAKIRTRINQDNKIAKVLNAVPKAYYVILQGVVLAIIWAWLFEFNTKEQFSGLFVSIMVSMIGWKLGFSKIGSKIQDKVTK